MRRLLTIMAFALFLAVPVWAQHGGGHGGSGGHAGGFGGGHSGGFGGGHSGFSGGHASGGVHAFSGPRSGSSINRFSSRGFSSRGLSSRTNRGPFLHNGGGVRLRTYGRNYGFRNNCYGWRCWGAYGYPYWGYEPWWWDSSSNYDDDYDRNLAIANEMNEQSLEQQRMMRQEDADGDQDAYARPPRAPQSANKGNQGGPALPATVLVFRDQHKQEVQNYAIVGQTLWNFAPQRTEKISLADLDLTATTKANEERGITFRVPAANPNVQPMQGQPLAPVVQSPSV